jgi:hypothetical protein
LIDFNEDEKALELATEPEEIKLKDTFFTKWTKLSYAKHFLENKKELSVSDIAYVTDLTEKEVMDLTEKEVWDVLRKK